MKKTKATKKAEQKKTEQTAKVVEQRSAKKLIIFKVSISQFGGKVIDRDEAREAEKLVDELLKTPAKKQEEVKAEPRKIEVPDILKSALDTNTSIVAESNGDGTNEHNSKSVLDGLKI